MKKYYKKGDLQTFALDGDFEGCKVTVQHLGAAQFRTYGFAFQRVSVKHGVAISEIGTPKTLSELDALREHVAVFDDIVRDTVVRFDLSGEILEGSAAADRIVELGLGGHVGMRALDFQRLLTYEVLS